MKDVLLFITLLLGSVSFGQTISINGSLHSTNGDNTFPIWVEEGTTIQPNSPIKSISIKEFNVVPNSNGNDLVFNKTVLVYSDSVSNVPEGKTWKLESAQNELQIGDEYAGGIVFYLDGNGGGLVYSNAQISDYGYELNSYCDNLDYNGYSDWYSPNNDDLQKMVPTFEKLILTSNSLRAWSSQKIGNNRYYIILNSGAIESNAEDYYKAKFIPIRQF